MLEYECGRAASLFETCAKTEPNRKKLIIFRESKPGSVYSYSIVAGQFKFYERIRDDLPRMRIYCRASLFSEIDHMHLLDVIESGIKFYEDFFGTPYPFRKYEIAFVPEYNFGAI